LKIKSFYVTKTFLVIIEFDNSEYRLLDMRRFLHNEEGLMTELINDVELFMTACLDKIAGTIRWENGVDFDPEILFKNSVALNEFVEKDSGKTEKRNKTKPTARKFTRLPNDYESELSKENKRLIKLLRQHKWS
jgi:hypothetical protein